MADLHESQEYVISTITEGRETSCWGCGLRLRLPPNSPVFKCSWCGAITDHSILKHEHEERKGIRWRRLRDRCFVFVLVGFMLFVICGGVWAVYPFVFAISYFWCIFHLAIIGILSVSTISMFSLAAFKCAGKEPSIYWGSYPVVGKGVLENYTFCNYCSKPKSPRTHHCRSCQMCILDMDHHCPFIGNCVGAANHRHFIAFLICAVISTIYVSIISAYAGFHIWPSLEYRPLDNLNGGGNILALKASRELIIAMLSSAGFVSTRGLVLSYLFIASVSVQIGLSVLLWQQLCYIYKGETYLSHLSLRGSDMPQKKDCENIFRFFGCPYHVFRYWPNIRNSAKRHKK